MSNPFLKSEFLAAAHHAKAGVRELTEVERAVLRESIRTRFTLSSSYGRPLHDALEGAVSVQGEDAWRLGPQFLQGASSYVLFNELDEPSVFKIDAGCDYDELIAHTTGFEMYLVGLDLESLICVTDFDVLIGAGTAANWLSGLQRD